MDLLVGGRFWFLGRAVLRYWWMRALVLEGEWGGWMDGCLWVYLLDLVLSSACIYELVCLPQVTFREGFVSKARVLCRGTWYVLSTAMGAADVHVGFGTC